MCPRSERTEKWKEDVAVMRGNARENVSEKSVNVLVRNTGRSRGEIERGRGDSMMINHNDDDDDEDDCDDGEGG